jgi:hypothetical protein
MSTTRMRDKSQRTRCVPKTKMAPMSQRPTNMCGTTLFALVAVMTDILEKQA